MGIQALSTEMERHPALAGEGYNAQRARILPEPGGTVKAARFPFSTPTASVPIGSASVVPAVPSPAHARPGASEPDHQAPGAFEAPGAWIPFASPPYSLSGEIHRGSRIHLQRPPPATVGAKHTRARPRWFLCVGPVHTGSPLRPGVLRPYPSPGFSLPWLHGTSAGVSPLSAFLFPRAHTCTCDAPQVRCRWVRCR